MISLNVITIIKCCSLLCIEYFTNKNEVTIVILLCYTSVFSEVIYADFYVKILDWNFRLVDENSQILVVVFVTKLNFSFRFRFVDENCRIFVIVVIFVMKINLFSSTKIFVFVVVDKKNTGVNPPCVYIIMSLIIGAAVHVQTRPIEWRHYIEAMRPPYWW